jgi:hypothetical protein
MQVDGPSHFTNNTLRPLGPTLLKRQLLAARGWQMVSVPYFHWSELLSDYERQLYIYLALQVSHEGIHNFYIRRTRLERSKLSSTHNLLSLS